MPAEAAIKRMDDTLWNGVSKDDVHALDVRLNNMSIPEMVALGSAQYDCGIKTSLQSLNGTNLLFGTGRPMPPRRP